MKITMKDIIFQQNVALADDETLEQLQKNS
jgi:hypothetical protein